MKAPFLSCCPRSAPAFPMDCLPIIPNPIEGKREEHNERILQGTEGNDRIARRKIEGIEGFLPLDIIIEILSRTPGSSLVTFKRVCKLWYSLTYDDRLINSHVEHASRLNPPRIIIFSQHKQGQQKYHLTLLDEAWNTKYRLTRASVPVLTTPPCNGLICLYDYHRNIKLCNPTTQEFLLLPKPTVDNRTVINAFPKCSFGFDPLTNKYKVVRFFYLEMNHKISNYVLGCEVFTLGLSVSWRYIGNVHCYVTGEGINVNGSLYWTTGVANIPAQIIALDLNSEKFRVVSPPDVTSYEIKVDQSMFMVQLEGNLCLVNASSGASTVMDIWMLKDFNNMWIHRCRVPLKFNLEGDSQWRPEPIFIFKGKMLLRWGGYLYYHDLEGKQKTVQMVYNDKVLGSTDKFYAFVESLVLLKM